MPIDPDQTSVVLEALAAADTVDARAIDVSTDGDVLVLRGSVATFEESAAAAGVAESLADSVRNELRVDVNLREGEASSESPQGQTADSLRGSSFDPLEQPDDLVEDLQESLEENLPWDPPTEAVEVPTRAEARRTADGTGHDDGPDDLVADAQRPVAKSLADLTPEELSRAAHPQPQNEETS